MSDVFVQDVAQCVDKEIKLIFKMKDCQIPHLVIGGLCSIYALLFSPRML